MMEWWSIRQIKITIEGNCIIGEYEPGNGTRYTAVAVPWTNGHDRPMWKEIGNAI